MSGYDPKKRRGHRDEGTDEPAPVDALLGPPPGGPAAGDTTLEGAEPADAAALAPVPGAPVAVIEPEPDPGEGAPPEPPVTVPAERRAPATALPERSPAPRRPPVVPTAVLAAVVAVLLAAWLWLRRRR